MVVTPLGLPASAEAHGHHGGVYVGVGFGGFYGWGPYWGWGAPYWGWGPWPYAYGAPGGSALGYAMMSGMGALDMSVNPKQAEVWVDGKYVADARDLDGDPSYLWLKRGRTTSSSTRPASAASRRMSRSTSAWSGSSR